MRQKEAENQKIVGDSFHTDEKEQSSPEKPRKRRKTARKGNRWHISLAKKMPILFLQKPWELLWSSHSKQCTAAGLGPSMSTEIFTSKLKSHQVFVACFQIAHLPTV